jgi:hypothetical protein
MRSSGDMVYRSIERIADSGRYRLNALEPRESLRSALTIPSSSIAQGEHTMPARRSCAHIRRAVSLGGLLLEPQPERVSRRSPTIMTQRAAAHSLENAALAQPHGTMSLYTVAGATLRASFARRRCAKQFGQRWPHRRDPGPHADVFPHCYRDTTSAACDLLVHRYGGFDYEVVKMALSAGIRPRLIATNT